MWMVFGSMTEVLGFVLTTIERLIQVLLTEKSARFYRAGCIFSFLGSSPASLRQLQYCVHELKLYL